MGLDVRAAIGTGECFLGVVWHHGDQMVSLPGLGAAGHHDRGDLEGPRLQHGHLSGGATGIPRELHEAAKIDGASSWQGFWHITIPLLNPTIVFITVTAVIGSLQVFTPAVIMTTVQGEAGGPINSTRVMVYHIYSTAFRYNRLGYGAALAFLLFALILVITLVQMRLTQREVEYG